MSALDSQKATDDNNSLETQERVLTAAAQAAGYSDVIVVSERHTGSKAQPELEAALEMLANGQAAALYAHKIDRLSRSGAADVLRIADRASKQGWRLVVTDVAMDTETIAGRLVLTILAGVAEMESRRRSERMKEYHAARRARGDVSGATYGRKTTASLTTQERILSMRDSGASWQSIAETLNAAQADSRKWHMTSVRRVHAAATKTMLAA